MHRAAWQARLQSAADTAKNDCVHHVLYVLDYITERPEQAFPRSSAQMGISVGANLLATSMQDHRDRPSPGDPIERKLIQWNTCFTRNVFLICPSMILFSHSQTLSDVTSSSANVRGVRRLRSNIAPKGDAAGMPLCSGAMACAGDGWT